MKKLLALLCIGVFLFSCVSVSAETGKSFDHTQLSRFAGYEYDASDRSWQYYVSTYCMGQKSPYFFTDTHLVHIGLKAYGYLSDPENVYTHLTILAMNSSGQIEDIDKVWLMFKVDNEVVTININVAEKLFHDNLLLSHLGRNGRHKGNGKEFVQVQYT